MILPLATSYEGLPEFLAGCFAVVLVCAGIAVVVSRSSAKWVVICGIVLAGLSALMFLPPAIFVFAASAGGGPMALGWLGLIILALASCASVVLALRYTIRRLKTLGPSKENAA